MVKLLKKFMPGDKVFAKVRGYPPWPARVESVSDPNTKGAKYKVYFYGTSETAVCKVDELFDYHDNKEKFGKPMKRKLFHQGIQQLEQELSKEQGKSSFTENRESVVEESETEIHSAPTDTSTGVNLDSDLETGPLVIDETDKKKPLKRKSVLSTSLNMDVSETKKKRGRGKTLSTSILDAGNDSQGEDTIGKEVVSRSGRKIKPKRFADFSADDEYEIETMGRARVRIKQEETNENITTPSSAVGKKRIGIESFNGFAVSEDEKKIMNKDVTSQKQKIRWLRIESQLLQLDAQIKSNLGLDQADTEKCLQAMDDMLGLSVDPLMLKKHPHIVETVKRLRRYIGNLAEWKLSEDEIINFKEKAEKIREKAEYICNKFKAMFTINDGQSFWLFFSDQVDQLKDVTKNMSEEEFFSLITDPTSESAAPLEPMSDESLVLGEISGTEQELPSEENSPSTNNVW